MEDIASPLENHLDKSVTCSQLTCPITEGDTTVTTQDLSNQEASSQPTVKEQLIKEIEQTPEELLEEVLDFLLFLKTRDRKKNSTARSILEHLKHIGTWEGDDLEECLQLVYDTRGRIYFPTDESDEDS